jgi:hypothetical protein
MAGNVIQNKRIAPPSKILGQRRRREERRKEKKECKKRMEGK